MRKAFLRAFLNTGFEAMDHISRPRQLGAVSQIEEGFHAVFYALRHVLEPGMANPVLGCILGNLKGKFLEVVIGGVLI
jgi:hypothetical protein